MAVSLRCRLQLCVWLSKYTYTIKLHLRKYFPPEDNVCDRMDRAWSQRFKAVSWSTYADDEVFVVATVVTMSWLEMVCDWTEL